MADGLHEKPSPSRAASEILEGATAYLRFLKELGNAGFDLSEQSLETIASWSNVKSKNAAPPDIFNNFIKCRQCSLAAQRQHVISGMGNPNARLMIIGDVPEADDAQTGKPYSGKAGGLLDKMLSAMSLTRSEIYVTFAVKCCLPDDTKPSIPVMNCCKAYLRKELIRVRPDIIFAFGGIAAMSLLETSAPLTRLRGRFHDYKGIPLMPTHAPEYLVENPDAKREAWEDIKLVMKRLKN